METKKEGKKARQQESNMGKTKIARQQGKTQPIKKVEHRKTKKGNNVRKQEGKTNRKRKERSRESKKAKTQENKGQQNGIISALIAPSTSVFSNPTSSCFALASSFFCPGVPRSVFFRTGRFHCKKSKDVKQTVFFFWWPGGQNPQKLNQNIFFVWPGGQNPQKLKKIP